MKKESELRIKKIYPHDWDKQDKQYKQKKLNEFIVASFLLNDHTIKNKLINYNDLCIKFSENPDFIISSTDVSFKTLGLEIIDCYKLDGRKTYCISKTLSDLKKICTEVIKDIQNSNIHDPFYGINSFKLIFKHEIIVCGNFDKNKLKEELRDFILNKDKRDGNYLCSIDIGYNSFFKSEHNIEIFPDMAYIVPSINNIALQQQTLGIQAPDPVLRSIEIKEEKLVTYKTKQQNNIDKWWLCINVPQNEYMNPQSYKLPTNFESKYDRIYLVSMSHFGYGIHLLYSKN